MTIIVTLLMISYVASVMLNIAQKKNYITDQMSGELRTSNYTEFFNVTSDEIDYSWKFNECFRNLSECKTFTLKEFAEFFIDDLEINVYVATNSRLNCSNYSASLITFNERELWS